MDTINEEGDAATETAVEETTASEATEKAVETPVEPTDSANLTEFFAEKPQEEVGHEDELSKESEKKEEAEENQEADKTEPTKETEESEDAEEEEEAEGDQKEDSNNVLSKDQKSINKLRKRVDKTTKNWKTTEEKLDVANQRIESLERSAANQKSVDGGHKTFAEIAKEADSAEDLQDIRDRAMKAKKWARKNLTEEFVTVNDVEFSRDQIHDLLDDAEQALDTHIPKREQLFNDRAHFDKSALETFPFLADEDSVEFKEAERLMQDAEFNGYIQGIPDGSVLLGYVIEGMKAVQARGQKDTETPKKEVPKKKPAVAKKKAPIVPGLESNVTPTPSSDDDKKSKRRQAIMDKPSIDVNDLAAVFAS